MTTNTESKSKYPKSKDPWTDLPIEINRFVHFRAEPELLDSLPMREAISNALDFDRFLSRTGFKYKVYVEIRRAD